MSPAKNERFIYCASCVAVAAKISGANPLEDVWGTAVLPMIGGKVSQTVNGPAHPVLKFDSATASVNGFQNNRDFVTQNEVTVTGVNILNRVTAKGIQVGLTFTQNSASGLRVDVAVKYDELKIDGTDFSNLVLEPQLAASAGNDHKNFRARDLPARRNSNQSHQHSRLDRVFTSLADPDRNSLKFENKDYGFLDVDGLGRVFFAEWAEEQDWQGIVGLRVVLNSQNPQASGEILIADYLGNNGQFYP